MAYVQLPPDGTGKKIRHNLYGDEYLERVADDFDTGEVLAQQTGAAAVLTFTFSAAVQMVCVESAGALLVSKADPFGGTPSSTLGIPCRDEVPVYLPVTTTVVKVYAPTAAVVNVWGYRRT